MTKINHNCKKNTMNEHTKEDRGTEGNFKVEDTGPSCRRNI